MPRFKLLIEYAGTRYSGWQIQKNARTVQGEIDRAARVVTGRRDFELYGSGRTDAGVHARGQVAHLDVATTLPPDRLVRQSAGTYRTEDDRFEVRSGDTGWFVVDSEQTNEFGQELMHGPFATRKAAREAVPGARSPKVTALRRPRPRPRLSRAV